ncbi:hypothetical protein [Algoriphagus mannitolivorans]|uniref:hypothetical protein n=1 Tax=Algoriphagus mannitolivorans TaxID=226504 RepID=UPI000404FCED|nr:hypothetical protein [Algoriphagus mannitolivorans]
MTWFYRIALLILFVSCSVEEPDADFALSNFYEVNFGNVRFQADPRLYQKLNFERTSQPVCRTPVSIKGIKRSGDILTLKVKRSQNCTGKYSLVWDGSVQESNPERVQLYLYPELENCSQTGELVEDVLVVDLKKAFQTMAPQMVERMYLYVREYCNYVDYLCEGDCELNKN